VRSLGCFGQRLVAAKIAANLRSAIAPASCKYNPSLTVSQSDFEVDDSRFWPITTCSTAVADGRFRGKAKLNGRQNRVTWSRLTHTGSPPIAGTWFGAAAAPVDFALSRKSTLRERQRGDAARPKALPPTGLLLIALVFSQHPLQRPAFAGEG
jgi:hypothetical protein